MGNKLKAFFNKYFLILSLVLIGAFIALFFIPFSKSKDEPFGNDYWSLYKMMRYAYSFIGGFATKDTSLYPTCVIFSVLFFITIIILLINSFKLKKYIISFVPFSIYIILSLLFIDMNITFNSWTNNSGSYICVPHAAFYISLSIIIIGIIFALIINYLPDKTITIPPRKPTKAENFAELEKEVTELRQTQNKTLSDDM